MRKSDELAELPAPPKRAAHRFFRLHGLWYLQTREGERGPFKTRAEAKLELLRYIDTMEYIEEFREVLPEDLDCEDVTLVEMDRLPSHLAGVSTTVYQPEMPPVDPAEEPTR